jgi:uncharacterized protein
MRKEKRYKIAILLLASAIIIETIFLIIGRPARKVKAPAMSVKGKIAIVLDDWGYNLNNLDIASSIKHPLTASVLPGLPYSETVSAELHSYGFQIMLHLPLEPQERYRMEKNTILISQGEDEIRNILKEDLGSVQFVKGVSNHMGSLATEDPRVMGVIFSELKKKGLFFLDSFATPRSICKDLSKKAKIAFARRDVFLDNKSDPEYIKEQLNKLKLRAKEKGSAIGIGHDRRNTLLVLREMMPRIEKEGYKFVFVSEMAK